MSCREEGGLPDWGKEFGETQGGGRKVNAKSKSEEEKLFGPRVNLLTGEFTKFSGRGK